MEEVYICELCQLAYEPEEMNGVRKLKEFKGYTVDLRVQQFRKIIYGKTFGERLEFIQFNSPKGKTLLAQMHWKVAVECDNCNAENPRDATECKDCRRRLN